MDLQIFKENGWQIRAIEKDGEPWFIASDVAKSLGYERPNDAVRAHCKKVNKFSYGDSQQPYNIIPESDLYRLIMRSNLPKAEEFQDWVVEQVIPSIRKTGSYSVQVPQTLPEALRAYADEVEAHAQTKAIAEEMKPKAEFFDTVVDSKDAVSFRDAAKLLCMCPPESKKPLGQNQLFEYCRNAGILMENNQPYQKSVDAGHFKIIESKFTVSDETKISKKTVVLQKGLEYLMRRLEKDGYTKAQ